MYYREVLKRTPLGPPVRWVRRRRARRPVSVDVAGLRVRIPRRDWPRYANGFETLTIEWVRQVVRPGMTVVDVGAALGFFSLHLARMVGPAGRIIAIEPAPQSVKLMKANAAKNGFHTEVVRAAASSECRSRQFFLTDSSDSHAFFHHPLISPSKQIKVPTIRLDSVIESADFLKIDVEGAEIDVLEGARNLLAERPPMVVEWVPACQVGAGRSVSELPQWLIDAGYRCEVLDELNSRQMTVRDATEAYERGDLPLHWYANLCCAPC